MNRLDRCLVVVTDPIKPLDYHSGFFFRICFLVLLPEDFLHWTTSEETAIVQLHEILEVVTDRTLATLMRLVNNPLGEQGLWAWSHKREARNFGNLSVSTELHEHCSPFRSSREETSWCDRFQRQAWSKSRKHRRLTIPIQSRPRYGHAFVSRCNNRKTMTEKRDCLPRARAYHSTGGFNIESRKERCLPHASAFHCRYFERACKCDA